MLLPTPKGRLCTMNEGATVGVFRGGRCLSLGREAEADVPEAAAERKGRGGTEKEEDLGLALGRSRSVLIVLVADKALQRRSLARSHVPYIYVRPEKISVTVCVMRGRARLPEEVSI